MKNILSSLFVFLRQEWISVAVYVIATILFFFIIFNSGHGPGEEQLKEHQRITILMISMLSIFVGLYLGSGFLRLKQSFLWQTLSYYRTTLVISFVSAAVLYALLQMIPMRYSGWNWAISLLAPICVTLLAAQLVIGNNIIMKFTLPAAPFILFQLTSLQVDENLILVLLVIFTSLAVYLNYTNDKAIKNATLGLMSGNLEQQMKNSRIQSLNNFIGDFFHWLGFKNKSKNFAIALMLPHNRYGVSSLTISSLTLVFFHLIGDKKLEIEGLAAFMLVTILMGVFIELKMLAKQCKPFAHLYSENQFAHFKNEILTMLQKYLIIQSIVFIISVLTLNLILDDFVDIAVLLRNAAAITLVAMIFLPAMLCLNWFSINFKLLGVMISYIGLAMLTCGWFFNFDSVLGLLIQLVITATLLISTLFLSRTWWKMQPVEQFMRVYG